MAKKNKKSALIIKKEYRAENINKDSFSGYEIIGKNFLKENLSLSLFVLFL